jgi:long-chain acyl-CoA synthetase
MKSLYEQFFENYKKNKNKTFINIDNKSYSFDYVFKAIEEYNNFFNKFSNNKIAIIKSNSCDHVILYLLCSKLSLTFIPIDPTIPTEDIINQINYAKISYVFCSDFFYKKFSQNNNKNTKNNFFYFNLDYKKKFNTFKSVIKLKNIKFNNTFLLSYTSGSTGQPKPIAFSERVKILRARSNINLYKVKKNSKTLISTPLHHTLAIRILNISIIQNCEIFIIKNYSVNYLFNKIYKEKIRFTIFVSSQINSIVNNLKKISKLRSLNSIISSSGTLAIENKIKLLEIYKKDIHECYGLSELAIISNLNLKKNKSHLESVGKPIPHVKIKILKNDNTEIGEIICKSKYKFLEYYNKKTLTKKNFVNNFFKTGDLGYMKDGFLYFVGRKKNLIKIQGTSVYPEDIENKLLKSNLVLECAVCGIEDKFKEEKIALLYVKKNKSNYSDWKIKDFCIKNLAPFQLPRYFISVNDIPKNQLGKIDRLIVKKNAILKINEE